MGTCVEQALVQRSMGDGAGASVELRARAVRSHRELRQIVEGRAVEEGSRSVGIIDLFAAFEGRQIATERRRPTISAAMYPAFRRGLESGQAGIASLSEESKLGIDTTLDNFRFRRETRRPGNGKPSLNLHIGQTDDIRGTGACGAGQAVDHRHESKRGDGPGWTVVTKPGIALRIQELLTLVRAPALGGAVKRGKPPRNDAHAEPLCFVDTLPVAPEGGVAHGIDAAFIGAGFDDLDRARDQLILGHDLTAVLPGMGLANGDGLEARILDALGHAGVDHVKLKELEHRLDAQRPGLHGVLEEVSLEEPLVRVDVLLGAQEAEPLSSTARIERRDAVDHQEHGVRETERAAAIPFGTLREVDQEVGLCLDLGPIGVVDRKADLIGQGFAGKETEHGPELVGELVIAVALHLEGLDDHAGRLGDVRDLHLGAEDTVRGNDLAMDGGCAVEVAEGEILLGGQRTAHIAGEPTAWLERRFEEDAERHRGHAVFAEVPLFDRGNVVLNDDLRAGLEHTDGSVGLRDAAHEVVWRTRKASDAAGAVEDLVHRAKRVARLAPRAREEGGVVELEVTSGCDRLGLLVVGEELGHRGHRPVRNHPQSHPACVESAEAVDRAQEVGVQHRDGPVMNFLDEDLVGDLLGARDDLAATQELVLLVWDGLETPTILLECVAEPGHVEGHHLQAALKHQGAGHAGVVLEVSAEKPVVGMDLGDGLHVAAAPGTALGIEVGDLLEEQEVARLNFRRPSVRLAELETQAEAAVDIRIGERADLLLREARTCALDGGRIDAGLGDDFLLLRLPENASGVVELPLREEACLPTANGEHRLIVDVAIVVEEEEADVALAGMAVDMNVVAKGFAGAGKRAMIGELATEESVSAVALVQEVGPEVADQEEVGLTRLDHDAGGHVARVHEPVVFTNVGLSPNGALLHGTGLGVDPGDARRQKEGRLGHAALHRVRVLLFEEGAEDLGDAAARVDLECGAIERRALWRRRRHWRWHWRWR